MYISKKAPVQFTFSDILAPEMLNEDNGYFTKAFSQQANAQTCRWSTTYSLVPNATTTLTSATSTSFNIRRVPTTSFRAINSSPPVIIESVTVNAFYTATVPFTLTVSGTEVITFPVRDASLAAEPFLGGNFVTLMNLISTDTILTLTIPVGVSITKFDVTVGFSSDKYTSGNYISTLSKPTLTLPQFSDASSCNATVFSGMKTSLETAATAAMAGTPCRWTCGDFTAITSGTNASLRYRAIPANLFATANSPINSNMRVIGAYIAGAVTGGTIGDTIRFGLANNVGTFHSAFLAPTFTAGVGGAYNFNSGNIGTFAQSFQLPSAAGVVNDRYIFLTVTGTATVTQCSVYLLIQ